MSLWDSSDDDMKQEIIHYAGYFLDPVSLELVNDSNQRITLRSQSLSVFKILAEHPNRLVTKEALQESVWPNSIVTDSSLTQCISDIRRALGDENKETLVTVPRQGYRLVPDKSDRKAKAISKRDSASTAGDKQYTDKLFLIMPAVFVSILICAVLVFVFVKPVSNELPASIQTGNDSGQPAIIIRRFNNLTDDARWERLADGITSDIVAAVSTNHWLRVLRLNQEKPEVGSQAVGFDIGFQLDGTIQSLGGKLKVTSTLINLKTNEVMWSEQWQEPESAFFSIQEKLLQKVDGSLNTVWNGVISKNKLTIARQKSTDNLNAYELFLLAAEHKHLFTKADYDIAEDYLRRALEIDPTFGKAWALLALIHMLQAGASDSLEECIEYVKRRVVASKKAVTHSPNDADTLLAESFLRGWQGNYEAAAAASRKAVNTAPNNADVLAVAAWETSRRFEFGEEAVVWARRAIELHSNPPLWYQTALGVAAFHAKDYQLAINTLSEIEGGAVPTNLYYLSLAYAHAGNLEMARDVATRYNSSNQVLFAFSHPATEGNGIRSLLDLHASGIELSGLNINFQTSEPPKLIAEKIN